MRNIYQEFDLKNGDFKIIYQLHQKTVSKMYFSKV